MDTGARRSNSISHLSYGMGLMMKQAFVLAVAFAAVGCTVEGAVDPPTPDSGGPVIQRDAARDEGAT